MGLIIVFFLFDDLPDHNFGDFSFITQDLLCDHVYFPEIWTLNELFDFRFYEFVVMGSVLTQEYIEQYNWLDMEIRHILVQLLKFLQIVYFHPFDINVF